MALVPDDFEVPVRFATPLFVLEPRGPEHNERDHEAWSSSIDHIHATPGFEGRQWPQPMSLDENLVDLEAHRTDFDARAGFAYTVLDPQTDEVIGCVYMDPDRAQAGGVTSDRGCGSRIQISTSPSAWPWWTGWSATGRSPP